MADMLTYRRHVGKVFAPDGRVTSRARMLGDIPGCVFPPKDKTWCQQNKIRTESTAELYVAAMLDFIQGNYQGRYTLWSEYWNVVKDRNFIGRSRFPGMA